ncbi:hypothetical protein cyc_07534 [Cyclospora cayetanensis]|uniref:CUE domain-containing protein n=1 Tax=Cyclospora cayetanensis TaxID=88456 RepID=A0A1D3D8A9_9EIME|nr:hypothetical protein cyc_07534 [Cyclospora cayetanensis]
MAVAPPAALWGPSNMHADGPAAADAERGENTFPEGLPGEEDAHSQQVQKGEGFVQHRRGQAQREHKTGSELPCQPPSQQQPPSPRLQPIGRASFPMAACSPAIRSAAGLPGGPLLAKNPLGGGPSFSASAGAKHSSSMEAAANRGEAFDSLSAEHALGNQMHKLSFDLTQQLHVDAKRTRTGFPCCSLCKAQASEGSLILATNKTAVGPSVSLGDASASAERTGHSALPATELPASTDPSDTTTPSRGGAAAASAASPRRPPTFAANLAELCKAFPSLHQGLIISLLETAENDFQRAHALQLALHASPPPPALALPVTASSCGFARPSVSAGGVADQLPSRAKRESLPEAWYHELARRVELLQNDKLLLARAVKAQHEKLQVCGITQGGEEGRDGGTRPLSTLQQNLAAKTEEAQHLQEELNRAQQRLRTLRDAASTLLLASAANAGRNSPCRDTSFDRRGRRFERGHWIVPSVGVLSLAFARGEGDTAAASRSFSRR